MVQEVKPRGNSATIWTMVGKVVSRDLNVQFHIIHLSGRFNVNNEFILDLPPRMPVANEDSKPNLGSTFCKHLDLPPQTPQDAGSWQIKV